MTQKVFFNSFDYNNHSYRFVFIEYINLEWGLILIRGLKSPKIIKNVLLCLKFMILLELNIIQQSFKQILRIKPDFLLILTHFFVFFTIFDAERNSKLFEMFYYAYN